MKTVHITVLSEDDFSCPLDALGLDTATINTAEDVVAEMKASSNDSISRCLSDWNLLERAHIAVEMHNPDTNTTTRASWEGSL